MKIFGIPYTSTDAAILALFALYVVLKYPGAFQLRMPAKWTRMCMRLLPRSRAPSAAHPKTSAQEQCSPSIRTQAELRPAAEAQAGARPASGQLVASAPQAPDAARDR